MGCLPLLSEEGGKGDAGSGPVLAGTLKGDLGVGDDDKGLWQAAWVECAKAL